MKDKLFDNLFDGTINLDLSDSESLEDGSTIFEWICNDII